MKIPGVQKKTSAQQKKILFKKFEKFLGYYVFEFFFDNSFLKNSCGQLRPVFIL